MSNGSKFHLGFKIDARNEEKVFGFCVNCAWIGIVKLSLLRSGYFSSAANVLTSSPKIWYVNKGDSFQLNWIFSYQSIGQRFTDSDFNSASACLTCCLSKDILKQDFLDIYLTTFWESVISDIQNLWGSSFFKKYLKFNLNLKLQQKAEKKFFCFWDNCILIGIINLSLLRTGYFSSAANMLTRSQKIWDVNKRDVFQLNWLGSDQWIS